MMRYFPVFLLLGLCASAQTTTNMFSIESNVCVTLTLPARKPVYKIEHIIGDNGVQHVPFRYADTTVTLDVTPQMMGDGRALFIVNRPEGRELSDRSAPLFQSVTVDGTMVISKGQSVSIPFQPSTIYMQVNDPSGISRRGLRIEANGQRVPDSDLSIERHDMGRLWAIKYKRPQSLTLENLRVIAADRSLLANQTFFSLNIEGALTIVEREEFSGGKALELGSDKAFAGMDIDLAAGDYNVEVIGYGPDSGSNSLWMEFDGKRLDTPIHLPESKPGIASALVTIDPRTLPLLTVEKSGKHILVFVLREGPAPVIDRVRLLRDGKEIVIIEAEEMIPTFAKP